jgi:hypothetical protein
MAPVPIGRPIIYRYKEQNCYSLNPNLLQLHKLASTYYPILFAGAQETFSLKLSKQRVSLAVL